MRLVKFPKIALTISDTRDSGKTCPACSQRIVTVVAIPQTAQDLLVMALLDFASVGGPTATELAARLPIRNAIVDAKNSVLLEDTDWNTLVTAVEAHRWGWTHEDVIKIRDAVVNAEEQVATKGKKR